MWIVVVALSAGKTGPHHPAGHARACRAVVVVGGPLGGEVSGEVRFAARSLAGMDGRELRDMRRDMQSVFQDPYAGWR